MEKPIALAHDAIHDTVEMILSDQPRGSLLDVPSGHGALAMRLLELGFDVSCCDLYPEIFRLNGIDIKPGDLDGRLEYDDDSFQYIVCIEGLEHIENPANALREFSRLLKVGGTLLVSVPNIMNIEERLKWLFNGYTSHFKPLSSEKLTEIRAQIEAEYSGMDEVALHINPIGYSEVRFLLEKNRFVLERTYLDMPKSNSWAFLPLVWLIRLFSRFSTDKKRKERWTNELNSKEVLLGGNTLIFRARKV